MAVKITEAIHVTWVLHQSHNKGFTKLHFVIKGLEVLPFNPFIIIAKILLTGFNK
jgi:hypothetical protein